MSNLRPVWHFNEVVVWSLLIHCSKYIRPDDFQAALKSLWSVRIYVTIILTNKRQCNLVYIVLLCGCCTLTSFTLLCRSSNLHSWQLSLENCALLTRLRRETGEKGEEAKSFWNMAKTLGRLKNRFMSKLRRPFCYKRVRNNKDGLRELVGSCEIKTQMETSPEFSTTSCTGSQLRKENRHQKNSTGKPRMQRDLSSTEVTDIDDFQENNARKDEITEEELSQMRPTMQERRRSSAFQRLKNWVKPEHRRDAICEQMEREIETSGVSLRQYRKFLATTYILYDLKMLWAVGTDILLRELMNDMGQNCSGSI